ncbi:hypothetical protein BB14905_17045 [Bacillus sp. B14905]|nr:hypothetical protein BB14905_17045 [Bacillus sp. B14905]
MLLWDIKAGPHNRMEIMLVGGTIAIAEAITIVIVEATTLAMVQHLF